MIIKLNTTATKYIGQLDFYSINAKEIGGVTVSIDGGITSVKKSEGASTTVTGTVTLDDGCTLNSVVITMGGTDISSCYNSDTGTFTITGITGNVVITANATSNSSSGEDDGGDSGEVIVALTAENKTYSDTENHLGTPQVVGSSLVKSAQGTKGIYGWDIPKYALVTVKVSGGGNYGMAITDTNDIVIEGFTNSTVAAEAGVQGEYTFAPLLEAGKLYVSTTKFVSASYVVLKEEDLSNYAFPIKVTLQSDNTKYISTSQTVGSAVKLADMGSTGYYISDTIPANATVKIKVVTGGNYGMVLADVNGNVLESKPSNTADSDGYITFTTQSVETKLYASKTKYTSGTYQIGG